MVQYNPLSCLPSLVKLADSSAIPVDNELQNLILNRCYFSDRQMQNHLTASTAILTRLVLEQG